MRNLNNWRLLSWLLFAISTLIQTYSLLHKLPFMSYGTVSINGISIFSIAVSAFATGVLGMDWWHQKKQSAKEISHA